MSTVTVKSSTIFISMGGEIRIYRSMDEVPFPLRKRLIESTSGLNSATILIADRRGRDEIARALRGEGSEIRSRLVNAIASKKARTERFSWLLPGLRSWRTWVALSLATAAGAAIWLVANFRY